MKAIQANGGYIKVAVGLIILITVVIGYYPMPQYCVEMTCISNTLSGLLLIVDGTMNLTKKRQINRILYLMVAVCILSVFLICTASLTGFFKFNFKGAFFFLHVINPIAFALCWLFFTRPFGESKRGLFLIPLLMTAYLIFDYTLSRFTGKFVYGFVGYEVVTPFVAVAILIVMYFLMLGFALLLLAFHRCVQKGNKEFITEV